MLAAHDAVLERITLFDLDRHFIDDRGSLELPPTNQRGRATRLTWLDHLGDHALLGRPASLLPEESGRGRVRFPVLQLDLGSSTLDTVGLALGPEFSVVVSEDGRVQQASQVEFGSTSAVAASDSTVFLSDTQDFWIVEMGFAGRILKRFGRAFEPRPVSSRDVEVYKAELLADAGRADQRTAMAELLKTKVFADTWPAHDSRMLVDTEGNLWVALRREDPDDAVVWSVFGNSGAWLGEVTFPGSLRITEIRSREVVGVWQDDFDVQTVRVYELRKPRSRGREGSERPRGSA